MRTYLLCIGLIDFITYCYNKPSRDTRLIIKELWPTMISKATLYIILCLYSINILYTYIVYLYQQRDH